MPPRMNLAINVEPVVNENHVASLRMGENTITVLSQSYNPVAFTSEGMKRGVDGMNYNISERDIRIIKKLGQGASSTVHKGFYARENKFVAIKKINVFEKEMRHQMMNDVKALCDSPNLPGLVTFFGAYTVPDSGQISIVLEYLDGGSLGDVLQKMGTIPENILSKITHKILIGLNYLHRTKHMVHRDIKPANILMNLAGEPRITDFGISAFIDSTLAVCQTFLGTVTYMSPERINNQNYSFPSDLWSLGLALVECALGKYPYDASVGPLQLMMEVLNEPLPIPPAGQFSEEFRDFIAQCMNKDPYQRPSAEQLLGHPFISLYVNDPVNVAQFMQCAFNPQEKLDEIALVFAFNYYALLSAGADRLKDLAPLYSEESVLMYDGEAPCYGRDAILQKLSAVAMMHSSFKVTHSVQDVDCQALGNDGSALVLVHGALVANINQPPSFFAETFVLSQIMPGEYYVANQMFRLFPR